MPEEIKQEGPTSTEEVVGVALGALGALREAVGDTKKSGWGDSWEARDRARDEREKKEYDNLWAHRAKVDEYNEKAHLEAKRANDLHAEWNKEVSADHADFKLYRDAMLAEAKAQTKAFQDVAAAITSLKK